VSARDDAAPAPFVETDAEESRLAPRHIAIIMDGNGRWAERRGLPRVRGHEEGVGSVREMARECSRRGVEQLTLYAFSVDNWKRPEAEVSFLMGLLARFLREEREEIHENNIRFTGIGRIAGLPQEVRDELRETTAASAENTGLNLCLALNYGGRAEIVDAARRIAEDVRRGAIRAEDLDESTFDGYLYQPHMPPPDLLIRTGGEMRVSDFLLWEISYAEIYVTPLTWPEFRREGLEEALAEFRRRERRFGGLNGRGSSR
jgi:undecaprenyl diphosphate synthase